MNTIDSLRQLIHRQFEIDPAVMDSDAPFAQYQVDSLTVAELLFAIEDEFHVTVPDSALGSIANQRELAQMLDELIAAKAS